MFILIKLLCRHCVCCRRLSSAKFKVSFVMMCWTFVFHVHDDDVSKHVFNNRNHLWNNFSFMFIFHYFTLLLLKISLFDMKIPDDHQKKNLRNCLECMLILINLPCDHLSSLCPEAAQVHHVWWFCTPCCRSSSAKFKVSFVMMCWTFIFISMMMK